MTQGRDEKLRSSADFRRVYREGEVVKTADLVVHVRRREDREAGRYGLAVSRKLGTAVARNRARRQLRAAVRTAGGVKSGVDCVISPQVGARLRVTELAQQIYQIMERQ